MYFRENIFTKLYNFIKLSHFVLDFSDMQEL